MRQQCLELGSPAGGQGNGTWPCTGHRVPGEGKGRMARVPGAKPSPLLLMPSCQRQCSQPACLRDCSSLCLWLCCVAWLSPIIKQMAGKGAAKGVRAAGQGDRSTERSREWAEDTKPSTITCKSPSKSLVQGPQVFFVVDL